MKMKSGILINLATLLMTATMVLAQHDHAMSNQAAPKAGEGKMHSCPHMAGAKTALDKLEKTLAAGRESSDPAKMKTALDQAQTQLADAKQHMSMCPMMGGGMMHHDGDADHKQHMEEHHKAPDSGQTSQ